MLQALTTTPYRVMVERPLDYLLSPESRASLVRYCRLFRYRTPLKELFSIRNYKETLKHIGTLVRSFTNQPRYTGPCTRSSRGVLTPRQMSILMAIYVYQAEQPGSYRGTPSGPTRSALETLTGLAHNPQMTRDLKTLEGLDLLYRVRVTPLSGRGSKPPPPGGTEVSFIGRKPRRHVEYRLSARSRVWSRVPWRPLDSPSAGGSCEGIHRNPSRRNYLYHHPQRGAAKSLQDNRLQTQGCRSESN